ncbi:Helix-turn-helix domain-containing protein [Saccharopolyspora antimicrobica]|uniref:Helix-turn-helix domain-containing protein n=1 Tax=Saccharopolyspora antimicrobica TaxID=455193 RepID=A0A1I4SJD2_9PSEU|nr:helix-turn-helix transcriptional regulator [Saccharopolyspora antimicrobica]RKT87768.1 helix-turn-helix protein [Saccharopolyspora antimicrobica]SFM64534.1 Helix-turn-helix domain-containing protein [Saccharopolyspora antimicrobica]
MARARQTLERRQLGLTLRRIREESGMSQQAAAEAIGRVRSRIVELEDGKGTLSQEDLGKLLDFYEVSGDERETALALGAQARRRQRGRTYTDLLPGAFQRFADLEASAAEISSYECGMVPGLLQTPEYVRALIDEGDGIWWRSSEAELEQRVAFRLDRQKRTFDASPAKKMSFVLTEESLRSRVGGPEIMRDQLAHLLDLLGRRADLSIQVLPRESYQNPARGGGFTLFEFSGQGSPVAFANVVYGPSTYFHDEADTATMFRVFRRLRDLALSAQASRQLIDGIMRGG